MIKFLLNDQQMNVDNLPAHTTLLEFIRDEAQLCGTKEGCASGDCGACTIALGEISTEQDATVRYRAINSCVTLLSAVQGKQVVTVEHLSQGGVLHPVQDSMVASHGSQCGFCTPGFVMSLFCLYEQNQQVNRQDVEVALSGNLCRCTGYRPIIDAAMQSCQPHKLQPNSEVFAKLKSLQAEEITLLPGLYLPTSRASLKELVNTLELPRLVAGSTDLALEITQQYQDLPELISLSSVPELNRLVQTSQGIEIGAAVTLSQMGPVVLQHFPELSELFERFASLPIRNQATLGGNVANASPIGDLPPVLLALDAQIVLDNGTEYQTHPASVFFVDYRKTLMAQDQWIDSIHLPLPREQQILRAYKVSKRIEDDISAVCAVFSLQLDDEGAVTEIRSGFGGVAATPVSCTALSSALTGKNWNNEDCVLIGKEILSGAFSPISDVRASAEYRNTLLGNLWQRFWLETQNHNNRIPTRIVNHA